MFSMAFGCREGPCTMRCWWGTVHAQELLRPPGAWFLQDYSAGWSTQGKRNGLPQGTDLVALSEVQAMLVAISHAGVWQHDDQGTATGPLGEAAMWVASVWLIALSVKPRLCPGSAQVLPPLHPERSKKSGVCKWAQDHAKLLNVPLQGDVGVACGVAVVQLGVM